MCGLGDGWVFFSCGGIFAEGVWRGLGGEIKIWGILGLMKLEGKTTLRCCTELTEKGSIRRFGSKINSHKITEISKY